MRQDKSKIIPDIGAGIERACAENTSDSKHRAPDNVKTVLLDIRVSSTDGFKAVVTLLIVLKYDRLAGFSGCSKAKTEGGGQRVEDGVTE